jgi:nicotinate-nucleotide pyrophosphorylase (carboxylating)
MLTVETIQGALMQAYEEDSPWGDVTTNALFSDDADATGALIARRGGVMAGGEVVRHAFLLLDDSAHVEVLVSDGKLFAGGERLVSVRGGAKELLRAERIALNFVQRMCGVATLTRSFVDAVAHTKARIVDTRKTTPGLRAFEKYAVTCGGGVNHRYSLSDAVLVKDNHLAHLRATGVSSADALRRVRNSVPFTTHIEVEVDRLDQIDEVLASGVVDSVLIDNFTVEQTRQAVELIAGRALVNASGGIAEPSQAAAIAETGVDLLSIGALTHSVSAVDIGLDLDLG